MKSDWITFYLGAIRDGHTPNVPATLRPEIFEALTVTELDAFLARLRHTA